MTKLCARGKSAAKRKFKVYPSAYANAYASKICAGKIKDPSGTKKKDWGPKKAVIGTMVRKLAKKVFGKKESQAEPNSSSYKSSSFMGSPLINLYQKKVKPLKAAEGISVEKLKIEAQKIIDNFPKEKKYNYKKPKKKPYNSTEPIGLGRAMTLDTTTNISGAAVPLQKMLWWRWPVEREQRLEEPNLKEYSNGKEKKYTRLFKKVT
jgi:hypothetical protein